MEFFLAQLIIVIVFHVVQMGTDLNCTKTKLHEVTKLYEGTKLRENKIARVHKLREAKFARITFLQGSKTIQKKKLKNNLMNKKNY